MQLGLSGLMFVGPELILFGIVVLVAAQLVCKAREPAGSDLMHGVLAITGWVMITTGILGVIGSLAFAVGVGAVPLGIFTIGVAVVVAIQGLVKRRESHRYALLWTMAAAAERSIPLAPAVRAFAGERRGLFALRALRLAEMLEAGVPLPDALIGAGRLLPPKTLPMICVGYESGALGPALRRAALMPEFRGTAWQSLAGKVLYLCLLVWLGLAIASFMMYMIVPRFIRIFDDFGTDLPEQTEALIVVSAYLSESGALLLLLAALSAVVLYTLLRYTGATQWELPGTNWLVRRLDTAVILDALAVATQHQQPLPQTLDTLARFYPKPPIRRRLWSAARNVAQGSHWCRALHDQGLIKQADLAVLQAAERVGNLPWALEEMADSSRRRLAYRLQAAVQLVFPPVVLLVGAMVMFFLVALFSPIIVLIQRLA